MAENKKSFLLYTDLLHTVGKLPDDKAGQLFKHILSYVNDLNPETSDLVIEIAFEPIKQSLKRDLRKYEGKCKQNRDNALARWSKQPDATACDRIKSYANHADSDSDSDNDSDIKKKRKRKEKVPFSPPTLEEVKSFFIEKGYDPSSGIKAWMSYDAANWFDSKGNPVLNWKQKMINVWFKDENKLSLKKEFDYPQVTKDSI